MTPAMLPVFARAALADACLAATAQLAFYWYWSRPGRLVTAKQRAWILTLITSFVVGVGSLPYVRLYVVPEFVGPSMFQDDRIARFIVTFFITFLGLDLAVGKLHYPEQISLFVGWVHHAVYMTFFTWLIWGQRGYTIGAVTTLSLEIPTFLLALGHCFPWLRHDLAYGLTFFVFRICLNVHLVYHWCRVAHQTPYPLIGLCPAASLTLHCVWFSKWCRMYAKLLSSRKGKEDNRRR